MFFSGRSAFALLAVFGVAAQPALAVCAPGQMAVGSEFLQQFTGPARAFLVYSGFLMTNNCKLISQNGLTQSDDQMCKGGYNKGASVRCDGKGKPTSAIDTTGQSWQCFPTTDSSCNQGGSGGRFQVLACCSRMLS